VSVCLCACLCVCFCVCRCDDVWRVGVARVRVRACVLHSAQDTHTRTHIHTHAHTRTAGARNQGSAHGTVGKSLAPPRDSARCLALTSRVFRQLPSQLDDECNCARLRARVCVPRLHGWLVKGLLVAKSCARRRLPLVASVVATHVCVRVGTAVVQQRVCGQEAGSSNCSSACWAADTHVLHKCVRTWRQRLQSRPRVGKTVGAYRVRLRPWSTTRKVRRRGPLLATRRLWSRQNWLGEGQLSH
jgi:hypothetical protein